MAKTKQTKFTHLYIPAELLAREDLNALEKTLIADICSFKNGYFQRAPAIAKKFGVDIRTIQRAIARLLSAGYIKRRGENKHAPHRQLELTEKGRQLLPTSPAAKQKKTKKAYAEDSDELRLATLLFDEIRGRKPDFSKPNLQVWAKPIDFMLHRDNRKPERIEQVIKWAQADSGNGSWKGWQNNILSTKKLREKFDKLELSMGQTDCTRETVLEQVKALEKEGRL